MLSYSQTSSSPSSLKSLNFVWVARRRATNSGWVNFLEAASSSGTCHCCTAASKRETSQEEDFRDVIPDEGLDELGHQKGRLWAVLDCMVVAKAIAPCVSHPRAWSPGMMSSNPSSRTLLESTA